MRPISISDFRIDDPFWSPRLTKLSQVTLPNQFDQIAVQTPRLENFKRVVRKESGSFEGRYYDDSDVYKWLEACAYSLSQNKNPKLLDQACEAIEAILAAQESDGYLHTFFQLNHPNLKFRNLGMMHEMYCMGHLIEAAVAWSECLSDNRLLGAAEKIVYLLVQNFGGEKDTKICGHEEIELALLRFANHSKSMDALSLAKRMIEQRGQRPSLFEAEWNDEDAISLSPWAKRLLGRNGAYSGEYVQDHLPIREHKIVVGHAVRAMYLYIAASQLAGEDSRLQSALIAVWENMTQKRMYVTGGIGSTGDNEGFTNDFDLPNYNSYAETCASVGLALWGRQMGILFDDAEYFDVAERAIFNGALAGISDSGGEYFYANPLESRADHQRVPWFECACCPPNIARMIGSIAQFAFGVREKELSVLFPIGGKGNFQAGSKSVEFAIQSEYPHGANASIKFSMPQPTEFAVRIRYPGWCDSVTCTLEGQTVESEYQDGFIVIQRTWNMDDTLEIEYEMAPEWVQASPFVFDNLGRIALTKGPLIYCLETFDTKAPAQHFYAFTDEDVEETSSTELTVNGGFLDIQQEPPLYGPLGTSRLMESTAKFVPYYSWSNQGDSNMAVWINEA